MMTVCRVEEVDLDIDDYIDFSGEMKWIISKVDLNFYNECIKSERDAIKILKGSEKRKKRKELRDSVLAHLEAQELTALPIYSQSE
jgi:hypothetical protein